jgi:hypothetical protein
MAELIKDIHISGLHWKIIFKSNHITDTQIIYNINKNKRNHTLRTISKSKWKIIETDKMYTTNTFIHEYLIFLACHRTWIYKYLISIFDKYPWRFSELFLFIYLYLVRASNCPFL